MVWSMLGLLNTTGLVLRRIQHSFQFVGLKGTLLIVVMGCLFALPTAFASDNTRYHSSIYVGSSAGVNLLVKNLFTSSNSSGQFTRLPTGASFHLGFDASPFLGVRFSYLPKTKLKFGLSGHTLKTQLGTKLVVPASSSYFYDSEKRFLQNQKIGIDLFFYPRNDRDTAKPFDFQPYVSVGYAQHTMTFLTSSDAVNHPNPLLADQTKAETHKIKELMLGMGAQVNVLSFVRLSSGLFISQWKAGSRFGSKSPLAYGVRSSVDFLIPLSPEAVSSSGSCSAPASDRAARASNDMDQYVLPEYYSCSSAP